MSPGVILSRKEEGERLLGFGFGGGGGEKGGPFSKVKL